MTVLKGILDWSQDRPAWQRDALRRLVVNGELAEQDTRELSEICKAAHGLADPQATAPLALEHVPASGPSAAQVSLLSIFHHRGVNALAEGQTLKLSPSLTVVYGDNAAGKTGYIRILKSACRARGKEEILGNVMSGATPHKAVVAIKYRVGAGAVQEWTGGAEDSSISRVSVFDTHCAAVYLTEKTDVAFRPFGLDVFDKLVKACGSVRFKLEGEQRTLNAGALRALDVPEGTAVAKLIASLSSLTKPETIRALASLSAEEKARLELLERSLVDLQANDPEKLSRELVLRAGRVRALATHLNSVEQALSPESLAALLQSRNEADKKAEEARRLREATFPQGLLPGTGAERWTQLWESARHFSEQASYTGRSFPVVENGAACVLCQQDLTHAAQHRLQQFEAFVQSTTEKELREAKGKAAQLEGRLKQLQVSSIASEDTLKEIRIENEGLADKLVTFIAAAEARKQAAIAALESRAPVQSAAETIWQDVLALASQLDERVKALKSTSNAEQKKAMTAEVQELRARQTLAKHVDQVLAEVERKKKVAAYELCLNDTRTQAITQKSTAVTKAVVTDKLRKSFQDELKRLAFHHVEVELKDIGGAQGVLYHKLILTRAPGVDLPRVVSEGEQRCLSIAAFFAELSTADNPSGIVFDDPVSSLDYKWRDSVAQRLVEEAKTRQVVVFTHDVVFLLLLKRYSEERGVDQVDQHVRQLSTGAGVCAEELPWVAMAVSKKIGYLKNQWQAAEKLHREGHQDAYEKEARYVYGLMREGWERALEEVLLSGVVERFREGVQTRQVLDLADITEDDCRVVEAAMTKCSKWLRGHDQAAAARAEIPDPAALKTDIEALENWVAAIRKRRRH